MAYRAYGILTLDPELLRADRMLGVATLGGVDAAPGPPKVPPALTGLEAGAYVPPANASPVGVVAFGGVAISVVCVCTKCCW